ncbi:MAG: ABC transporter permease [Lautropia sp.]
MPTLARIVGTRLRTAAVRCISPLLLLALWWLAAERGWVRELFLPSPASVVHTFFTLLEEGEILEPLWISLLRTAGGGLLALAAALPLGLWMARSTAVGRLLDTPVTVGLVIPKITFLPAFILWLGIGSISKIALVGVTCVFPLIVAVYHGARATPTVFLWSGAAMGVRGAAALYRVVLPCILPSVYAGVRVAVPVALITTYTAEMVAGGGGLGAALMYAQRMFETPKVFVYILLMLLSGMLLDGILGLLRRWFLPWMEQGQR